MERRGPLLDVTISLLADRGDMTLAEIATGAKVGKDWLAKLSQNRLNNPSVVRIQRLHDFLAAARRAQQINGGEFDRRATAG